jgi:hypothetical protein
MVIMVVRLEGCTGFQVGCHCAKFEMALIGISSIVAMNVTCYMNVLCFSQQLSMQGEVDSIVLVYLCKLIG